jgi:hypothetical protein
LASSLHVLHPTFAAVTSSGNVVCYFLFAMTSIVGVINLSPLEHTSPWASLHHILDRSCILNTLPFACTATPVSIGLFMVCVTPRPHNTIVRHLVFQSVHGAAFTLIKGCPKNGCWNLSFPSILCWLPFIKRHWVYSPVHNQQHVNNIKSDIAMTLLCAFSLFRTGE